MNRQFEILPEGKKVYFASDFHLGAPDKIKSLRREKKIIQWFDSIKHDAAAVFLVGDIFDFWFEYKHVIPKGYIRFQAKLLEFIEAEIKIIFFTGNHDMWMFDYFTEEFGIPIYRKPETFIIGSKKIYIGHGDGLGPGDHFFKTLKVLFTNRFCQIAFSFLHPYIGMGLASYWSNKSRLANDKKEHPLDLDNEWLLAYCKELENKDPHELYIFGHRHLPLELPVGTESTYYNLGEWINNFTYLRVSNKHVELLTYHQKQ